MLGRSMADPDRRSRLRSATSKAHARLDERVGRAGFFDDRVAYADYLEATLRARQSIKTALDRYGATKLFALWPQRMIASALRADIRDVSGHGNASAKDVIDEIGIDTDAQVFGVLYVLEGSALGARVLARRAEAIGMTASFGARHLALQTAVPKAWSNFLSILEAAPLDTGQEDECVGAAIETFDRFERGYG
jgi:heme oxygenase